MVSGSRHLLASAKVSTSGSSSIYNLYVEKKLEKSCTRYPHVNDAWMSLSRGSMVEPRCGYDIEEFLRAFSVLITSFVVPMYLISTNQTI